MATEQQIRKAHVLSSQPIDFGIDQLIFDMGTFDSTRVTNGQAKMLLDHNPSTLSTVGNILTARAQKRAGLGIDYRLYNPEKVQAAEQAIYLLDEEGWDGFSVGITKIGKIEKLGQYGEYGYKLRVTNWELGEVSFTPMPRYSGTKSLSEQAYLRLGTEVIELSHDTLKDLNMVDTRKAEKLSVVNNFTPKEGIEMENTFDAAQFAQEMKASVAYTVADTFAKLQADLAAKQAEEARLAAENEAALALQAEKDAKDKEDKKKKADADTVAQLAAVAASMDSYDGDKVKELHMSFINNEVDVDEFKEKLSTLSIQPSPTVAPGDTSDKSYSVERLMAAMSASPRSDEYKAAGLELDVSDQIKRQAGRSLYNANEFAFRNSALMEWQQKNQLEFATQVTNVVAGASEPVVGTYRADVPDPLNLEMLVRTIPVVNDLPKLDGYSVPAPTMVAEPGNSGYSNSNDIGVAAKQASPKDLAAYFPITRKAQRVTQNLIPNSMRILMQRYGEEASKQILQGTGTSNQATGVFNATGVSTVTLSGSGAAKLTGMTADDVDKLMAPNFQFGQGEKLLVTSPEAEVMFKGFARPTAVRGPYDPATRMYDGVAVQLTNTFGNNWDSILIVPQDIVYFVWDDAVFITVLEDGGLTKLSASKMIDVATLHAGIHAKFN